MPLKASHEWTEARSLRKVAMLLGPLDAHVRRHRRWTIGFGLAFAVNIGLLVPFTAGMQWHSYWLNLGRPLLLLCLPLFVAFVFEAAWTFIQWQYLTELRRSELRYIKGTRQVKDKNS